MPLNIYTKWSDFRNQLSQLNSLNIPRYIRTHNEHHFQLHGFCNASQWACVYIRSRTANDEFCIKLLYSKTNVAPIKQYLFHD